MPKPSLPVTAAAATAAVLACSLLPFLPELYDAARIAPSVVADLIDDVPTSLLLIATLLAAAVVTAVLGRRS